MYWAVALVIAIIILCVAAHVETIMGAWYISIPFFIFVIIVWVLVDYGLIGYLMSEVL